MIARIFSSQFMPIDPLNRTIENQAPDQMRLELIDGIFYLATQYDLKHFKLYLTLIQSMGLGDNGYVPDRGYQYESGELIKKLEWKRVYDLICRWWLDFKDHYETTEFENIVNGIFSSYLIAWDLQDNGQLKKVNPKALEDEIDNAFKELSEIKFLQLNPHSRMP